MVDLEAVEQNFDGITYSKGASVLVQLVAFVGQEEFLAGCREYFQRHAYGNTALGDLLAALHAASGRDLSGLVGAVAGDHRGEHPAARDRAGRRTAPSAPSRSGRAPPRSTRRCGRTGSPIGLYNRATGRRP